MPKTIYLPRKTATGHESSGLSVRWTPTAGRLDFGAWFDTFVGIEGDSMTLVEFCRALGITPKQLRKAADALQDDKAES